MIQIKAYIKYYQKMTYFIMIPSIWDDPHPRPHPQNYQHNISPGLLCWTSSGPHNNIKMIRICIFPFLYTAVNSCKTYVLFCIHNTLNLHSNTSKRANGLPEPWTPNRDKNSRNMMIDMDQKVKLAWQWFVPLRER